MLLTRVITAAIALPLVVAGILWLPTWAVALVLAAILAVGAWEWSCLARLETLPARAAFVLIVLLLFALLWRYGEAAWVRQPLLLAAALWWCAAVIWILRFPRGWDVSVGLPVVGIGLGLLLLTAPFLALVALHGGARGSLLMLLMFVLVWAADTGAYFCGHQWGRHKLAPRVSPGKTREGVLGGVSLAVIVALLGGWLLAYSGVQLTALALLAAVTAGISVVGDLTISMFKRQAGVKNSGHLFPGHGGVLDRLDSLLAAAPVFVLGLALITKL